MKRALVTGGGGRLGAAMARWLGARGWDVAVHYATSHQGAAAVVADIAAAGQNGVALKADLLDEGQMASLVARAAQALGGPLTLLVNNASVFEPDDLKSATRTSWDRHIDSNLRAPFVLIQQFAPQVPPPVPDEFDEPVAQGLVVNMLDQKVLKLTPGFMSYTIAKMGLWALTRTAAQALAPAVRVNAIGPGPTLQGARQTPANFKGQRRATVLQRGSNPADVTAALGFFIDSPGVTGQMIATDGGQHLAWKTPDVLGPE